MHVPMGVSQRKVWKKAISKSTQQIKVYEGFLSFTYQYERVGI